jgi:hypothetical protein
MDILGFIIGSMSTHPIRRFVRSFGNLRCQQQGVRSQRLVDIEGQSFVWTYSYLVGLGILIIAMRQNSPNSSDRILLPMPVPLVLGSHKEYAPPDQSYHTMTKNLVYLFP